MSHRSVLVSTGALLTLVSAVVVACGSGSKGGASGTGYANDGDTGAAAPATQQTLSPNPAMGDSTTGLRDRAGVPMAAGDSGQPTITADSMNAAKGTNPPPVRPTRP